MSTPLCTVGTDISYYFQKYKELGAGSFGSVYSARPTAAGHELLAMKGESPEIVAIKRLPRSRVLRNSFAQEISVLSTINIGSSVRYYGCFETPDDFYVIMEYFEGTALFELIIDDILSAIEKETVIKCIARALNDLHENGIVHRDLKPENVMINKKTLECKLIDYGLSCNFKTREGNCDNVSGSFCYLDPQLRAGAGVHELIQADWWSFGQLVYALYFGTNMGIDVHRIIEDVGNNISTVLSDIISDKRIDSNIKMVVEKMTAEINNKCIYEDRSDYSLLPHKIRRVMSLLTDQYASVSPARVRPVSSEILRALE